MSPTDVAAPPSQMAPIDLPVPEAAAAAQDVAGGLQEIGSLAQSVAVDFQKAMREIERINLQTKIISLNAQVEAARAGAIGNAFGVVASEMVNLSGQTAEVTNTLVNHTHDDIQSLIVRIGNLGQAIRGTRLSDLAMMNIDVIDRNLYERSCDVRWWATDSSVVDALSNPDMATRDYACKRLGGILDSYTVYYDIVLCNLQGEVIANGRRETYRSIGSSQRTTDWFQTAIKTRDGTQFGFQNVHQSSTLAGGQPILVYSCGVRAGGQAKGELIGVLGIVFNWEALGQTIVKNTLISDAEKPHTRVCIVDDKCRLLADTQGCIGTETLELTQRYELFAEKKCHRVLQIKGETYLVAHALSPGFETYATGWHSLILQKLDLG